MAAFSVRFAAVAAALGITAAAQAGLVEVAATMTRRADRADAAYLDFASAFPSVGRLNGSSGTLIAGDWVITAAHVVNAANPAANVFNLGGTAYVGAAVAVAPGWSGSLFAGNDLALLRLATPVTGVAPVRYNAATDEVGRVGTHVGFGQGGTGLTGATGGAAKRAGRNVLDATADVFNGPNTPAANLFSDRILVTDFDNPANDAANATGDNTLGSFAPLDLEFNVAAGDSGGGLFLSSGADWVLAGVTTFTAESDGTQNSDYGDFSGFTRTSRWADWIESQTAVTPAAVPEPSAVLLLSLTGACGAGLVSLKRRGRASQVT